MAWRQGDIYIESVAAVPSTAVQRADGVLAEGEVTGHRHRIDDFRHAFVYEDAGQLYVDVISDRAQLIHDEHGPIELARGVYRVWRQREFDPSQAFLSRVVFD
jgi:hypothetical protein